MIVRVVTEIDLDSGNFDLKFENISHPGEEIDYVKARRGLRKVVEGLDDSLEDPARAALAHIDATSEDVASP